MVYGGIADVRGVFDAVPLGYYRAKFESEQLIEGSGLPWTILRITQFHDLLLRGCTALARLAAMLVPAATSFQPIEVGEVADRLAGLAADRPAGRSADMGGPQVRRARDLAQRYLRATCGPPSRAAGAATRCVLRQRAVGVDVPPFNEHFVRGFGGVQLAVTVVLGAGAFRRPAAVRRSSSTGRNPAARRPDPSPSPRAPPDRVGSA